MRQDRDVLASWEQLVDEMARRPEMYVGRPRYSLVRSFVEGYGAARDDDVLHGFQQWLSSQPQNRAIRNYIWSSLLLHEAFPDRDQPMTVNWDIEAPANAGWPRPADRPIGEDDLSYPEDDAIAIGHLVGRLKEYLESR
jgi:hypothetical protein